MDISNGDAVDGWDSVLNVEQTAYQYGLQDGIRDSVEHTEEGYGSG